MILGVDASNLSAGGGMNYLRQLLHHGSSFQEFDRILVFGRPQLREEIEGVWGGQIRLAPQALLAGNVWRGSSPREIRAYLWNLVRTLMWRARVLPSLLRLHGVDVIFSPGGLLPSTWPERTRAVVSA